jgi:hypothetical protein
MGVYFSRLHNTNRAFKEATMIADLMSVIVLIIGIVLVEVGSAVIVLVFGITIRLLPYIMAILMVGLKAVVQTIREVRDGK